MSAAIWHSKGGAMADILKVEHLKKYFDVSAGSLHAVDDVSFSIPEGTTLGVVGESGCGKSTLGRVLIHLLESTDGKIFYKGEDITKVSGQKLHELRRKMQIIFQDPYASLNPRMTIYQTIAEAMTIAGGYTSQQINDNVFKIMDTVGLDRYLVNAYPHELDGGRRQRIGIARALILNPDFVVCDEPVSALDVSIQAQIINLLLDIQKERKITYVFITHDLSVVKFISNNIMVMYLGQMVEYADNKALFANPTHPYTRALLSAVPVPDIHNKMNRIIMKGEIKSPINPGEGCRFAARCPYAKDVCRQKTPALKETDPGHLVACHFAGEV